MGRKKVDRSKRANHVGLRPSSNWHRRNFLTEVLIPSMFTPRSGGHKRPNFAKLSGKDICVTWIGHASFLLRTQGKNILIDPNWSKWLQVIKRIRNPGLELHDLPDIDLVLITHAHFDHLDRKTLRNIAEYQPIIVPTGVGELVHDLGFNEVHELDEFEDIHIGPLHVTLTPCAHWGARMLHDSHRGFGGYIINADGRSIFHCGDSAYFDGFRGIGENYDIDIALLPIGAYDPPSGREVHMNPEQAVRTFIDLQANTLIPMHYGSFRLSFEPVEEPPERLLSIAEQHGILDRVRILEEGQSIVF